MLSVMNKAPLIQNIVGYWQRAYLSSHDRQELIFCLKTVLDDFRHISTCFYGLFVDFRDAFGNIKQEVMIQDLINAGIEKTYCDITADTYQDLFFEVICDGCLPKEINLTIGVKTGDSGSPVIFVISLDKHLRGSSELQQLIVVSSTRGAGAGGIRRRCYFRFTQLGYISGHGSHI